jgi:outer membrane protein assembly factor BamA
VGPVPIGIFNLRGAVFADAGAIWSKDDPLRLTEKVDGSRRLFSRRGPDGRYDGVAFGFGTGIRTAVYFLILKLDAAWNTDFVQVSRPRWHFSIGPEF